MSATPARVFGLPGGTLRRGSVADVTVFDPAAEWTVDPDPFLSKGRNSPYRGKRLTGRATCTIVGGRVVFNLDDGEGGTVTACACGADVRRASFASVAGCTSAG